MAELICFPQERNVGKARRVAAVYLRRRTDKARSTYWRDTCATLEWMMRRRGFSPAEIERQVSAFTWAVQNEINRLSARGNGPGAA